MREAPACAGSPLGQSCAYCSKAVAAFLVVENLASNIVLVENSAPPSNGASGVTASSTCVCQGKTHAATPVQNQLKRGLPLDQYRAGSANCSRAALYAHGDFTRVPYHSRRDLFSIDSPREGPVTKRERNAAVTLSLRGSEEPGAVGEDDSSHGRLAEDLGEANRLARFDPSVAARRSGVGERHHHDEAAAPPEQEKQEEGLDENLAPSSGLQLLDLCVGTGAQ